jgi:hypothetical protein
VFAANRRWNAQHFNLLAQQQQGNAPPYVPVWRIWLKPKLLHIKEWWWRLRWQLQQQQMPDTLSRVHVQELPASKREVVGIHQYSSTWVDGDHTGNLLEQQQARQQVCTSSPVVCWCGFLHELASACIASLSRYARMLNALAQLLVMVACLQALHAILAMTLVPSCCCCIVSMLFPDAAVCCVAADVGACAGVLQQLACFPAARTCCCACTASCGWCSATRTW